MQIYKNDRLIMEGKKENGLYMFDVEGTEHILLADNAPQNRKEKLQRTHTQLGHRNLLQVRKYVKQKLIKLEGFPDNITEAEIKALPLCDACQRAKFTKMRRRGRVDRTPPDTGTKMVTDMKGPIRIKGLNGQQYYQGFMDAHSKYLSFKCFKNKSTAANNLRAVADEPLYRNTLAHYHADGAAELVSKDIAHILKPRGAKMTFSAPYKSTDNSLIERSHRTIFEMAHAMLLFACLSVSFWCEAVAHAVYLYNRMPTTTESGYMSPLSAAFGVNPDLSNERTFGCTAYALVPQQTRERGFADRANRCLYLGHREDGSPGYILFHIAVNKIIFSSDVTFDESDLFDGSRRIEEEPLSLLIDDISRDPNDFKWLEGMAYRDDNQMFITTRVVVQHGLIVAYRAILINENMGAEESRPLHVADAERLVKIYTSSNDVNLFLGGETAGLFKISRTDEGGEKNAGPVVAVPLTGREGRKNGETDGRTVNEEPRGATSSGISLINAANDQISPTGAAKREGQLSAAARVPSVKIRHRRVVERGTPECR